MFRFFAVCAFALSACTPAPPAQLNMCQKAETYGEMFGTPEKKGPCWRKTIALSQTGNIRSYMVEMRLPYYSVGSVTYQGQNLVQAGISR